MRAPVLRASLGVFGLVLALWPGAAGAQDDLAARHAAADQYFELVPVAPLIEDSIAQMAALLPEPSSVALSWLALLAVSAPAAWRRFARR